MSANMIWCGMFGGLVVAGCRSSRLVVDLKVQVYQQ
jgi:hypothetical protein